MHTTLSGLYKNVTSGVKSRLLDLYGKTFTYLVFSQALGIFSLEIFTSNWEQKCILAICVPLLKIIQYFFKWKKHKIWFISVKFLL